MSDDLYAELQLIDLSRMQREAWLRWIPIMEAAGISDAEIGEVYSDLLAPETKEVRHAA